MKQEFENLLQDYFGYTEFRSGQLDIIKSIVSGKNTLAILPTGGGKSICFQIPGLFLKGTTIVISPLISLMKDQVDALERKNISATYINGSLDKAEIEKRLEKMSANQYKFVYVAPERLLNARFLAVCQKIKIGLIAIDEAHCSSMWGHDFRPSYQKIPSFIELLREKPIISAFTATATPRVKDDIIEILRLNQPIQFINSFQRDNLTLYNIKCHSYFDKEINLLRIISKHKNEAGIIYASTRKTAIDLSYQINFLMGKNLTKPVFAYHGGMTNDDRSKIQEEFINNKIQIIVATNAFGMGVDKSNIRYVIHYQVPSNIENFYQEAGRAGRDRLPSNCYLLFYPPDLKIQMQLIKNGSDNKLQTKIKINNLKKMIIYAQKKSCLQKYLLEYFGESGINKCEKMCGNCLYFSKESLINESEIEKIQKLFIYCQNVYEKFTNENKSRMSIKIIQYIFLLKPFTKDDFLKIPGVGKGWIECWHDTIQRYLLKESPTYYDN